MKNIHFLLIGLCLTSMLFTPGCEKAETEHAKHERLGIRAENCDYCPEEDCCCFVELTNGANMADLVFCGTTNPDISTNVCGPIVLEAPCDPINGFYWTESLDDMQNPNEFFCVEKGTSFMIGASGANGTSIRFHCRYGQASPSWVTLNLTAGEKHYYTVDEDCLLTECHLD